MFIFIFSFSSSFGEFLALEQEMQIMWYELLFFLKKRVFKLDFQWGITRFSSSMTNVPQNYGKSVFF